MQIIRNDSDYKNAVNYKQSFYNFPVTVLTDPGEKYIIGSGNNDHIKIMFPYILTVNNHLEYASLEKFDFNHKEIENIVFLQNSQDFENCENFFDLTDKEQVLFLSYWDNN